MDLQISDNNLIGKIPDSFRNFTRLDRVYFFSNYLSGEFPKEINLGKIRRLSIDNNMLSGPLPRVGELTETFTASDNLFSGPISPEIGNASGLIELSLPRNRLTGPIPNSIGNLTSLRYLNLDDNMFHGTLPKVPINIVAYSIKNNTMEGQIHSSICSSTFLVFFHVSNNMISGVVPDCFKNGSRLTSLNLYENQLQGLVPRSLKNCSRLQVLDLGKNMISNVFPQWLDTLPQLEVLVLKSGRLHGPVNISRSLLPFPRLRILDISGNLFTGHLPSNYFENFKAMMDINQQERVPRYMGNEIYKESVELVVKGQEMKIDRILTVLTAIDLSNNKFEGEIPDNIRMLNSLRYLNLSHNQLSGHIPKTIRNLTLLESLDLSSNQVTGKIPPELTRLTFMAVFNVSNNQLSGTIPQGGQFNTYETNSYQGNPALCGYPLPKGCRENEVATRPPLSPLQEDDDSTFFSGFTWQSVVLGYAWGIVLGIGFGCVMLIKGKPNWVLRLVNERKLRDD
uniref:receptor-like protein 19 n=1 Tax=Erigeron canadensis TaxID=72917 RepID=UPI001CB89E72|nr:receptor-like protein 19 [Erigeron canadensis]